jgi:hypothetical protein
MQAGLSHYCQQTRTKEKTMTLVAHPSEDLSLSTSTASTTRTTRTACTALAAVAAEPQRLQRAKKAYTTRFLAERLALDSTGYELLDAAPAAGDVVLAKVVEVGHHTKLESPASRRQSMFPGDEILVAFGNRYAPDQFLAVVPEDLGECSLVAGGGLAARVLEQHADIDKATTIQPIGLLAKDGVVVNLQDQAPHAVNHATELPGRPPVIAVLGTSDAAGLRVSAGKATGTGSGNDPRLFTDAGARRVLDFTDFGFPTTYLLDYETVRGLLTSLIDTLTTAETDVIVVEIADGVYQGETSRLLHDPVFHAAVDHVVFAAADALGATAGIGVLQEAGVSVPAVSGLLTASPLAAREAAGVITTRVINTYDLCNPATALELLPMRK